MDALTAIRQPVETDLERYKSLFEETLCHEDDYLGQALSYIRQRRGKMMRPLLVLLVARECGRVEMPALRAAVTLELLHTASLVHDDIVDESDERRGQASTNAVFGNKVAVLVGDYLLSMALHQSALTGDIRCVDIIARLGGTLSEGEVQQLANIRKTVITEDDYFDVIYRKTAAFFGACAQLGAIASGADEEFVAQAKRYGEFVGLCFQLRDDIFDYYEDKAIGKPTGNDMREGKLTLPAIHALEVTGDEEMKAIALRIKGGEASADEIARMVAFTIDNGGIDYAYRKMHELCERGMACLAAFHNDDVRRALQRYLEYVMARKA